MAVQGASTYSNSRMNSKYFARNAFWASSAPASDMARSARVAVVRARAPGDQRGMSVWPTLRTESAPQYRFSAFAVAIPTEKTMRTSGAMPWVGAVSPATRLMLGAASATVAPRTIGRTDPSVQPQYVAQKADLAPV